jgi:hypothetical protein
MKRSAMTDGSRLFAVIYSVGYFRRRFDVLLFLLGLPLLVEFHLPTNVFVIEPFVHPLGGGV